MARATKKAVASDATSSSAVNAATTKNWRVAEAANSLADAARSAASRVSTWRSRSIRWVAALNQAMPETLLRSPAPLPSIASLRICCTVSTIGPVTVCP
jgi:hypothetical protein